MGIGFLIGATSLTDLRRRSVQQRQRDQQALVARALEYWRCLRQIGGWLGFRDVQRHIVYVSPLEFLFVELVESCSDEATGANFLNGISTIRRSCHPYGARLGCASGGR